MTLLFLFALLTACPPGADDDDVANDDDGVDDDDSVDDDDAADDDDASLSLPEATGALTSTNSAGRSGAFFVPERGPDEAIPVLLAYHPTGGDGASFLPLWIDRARADGFAVVAPDSRVSPNGDFTWEVGTDPGEVTPDLTFAQDCLAEVLGMNVTLGGQVLAVGHSGGASSAPYLATNDARFSHFAVLHGGIFVGGLGAERPMAWLSTGESDSLRPPAKLEGYFDTLQGLGFDAVNTVFPGGHSVSTEERDAVVDWWLE